jgi:hypothetical protein
MGACRCTNTGPSEVKGCALDGASGHEKRGVYRYWIWFAQLFLCLGEAGRLLFRSETDTQATTELY